MATAWGNAFGRSWGNAWGQAFIARNFTLPANPRAYLVLGLDAQLLAARRLPSPGLGIALEAFPVALLRAARLPANNATIAAALAGSPAQLLAARRISLAEATLLLDARSTGLTRQLRVGSDALALELAANDAQLLKRLLLGAGARGLVIVAVPSLLLAGRKLTDAQPGAAMVTASPARLGRPLRRMVILL
jgi:hypothetical protein